MLFLESALLKQHNVVHGFSVRTGGVSTAPFDTLNLGGSVGDDPTAVDRNRRILFETAGVDPARIATVNQVHGDRVVFARQTPSGLELSDSPGGSVLSGKVDADAVIAERSLGAGVRTADCVPILLFDPRSGATAAVHAGWRGTFARITSRVVHALVASFAVDPAQLRAAIGPAIGPCCFQVAAELAERFELEFGREVLHTETRLNLFEANRKLLIAGGLLPEHVDVIDRCTSCEPKTFFSHRRDKGLTGRHFSFIAGGRSASP